MPNDGPPAGDQRHEARKEIAKQTRAGPVMRARRNRLIMDLRAAGLTEEQIAEQCRHEGYKITRNGVGGIIRKGLASLAEMEQDDVREVRQLDLYRIDAALQVLWPKVKKGDLKAMREYRSFIELRSRLLGTFAASKHEVAGQVTGILSDDDRSEIRRLEEAFRAAAPTEEEATDAEVVDDSAPALPSPAQLGAGGPTPEPDMA